MDARSGMWDKLEPHWQKLQQMNSGQRRMAAVIIILLITNIILVAVVFSGQSDEPVSLSLFTLYNNLHPPLTN